MSDQKKARIEAILFATNGLTAEEIARKTGLQNRETESLLEELELEHLDSKRGIHIIKDGDIWKMSVKPEMTPEVRDLLPPELPSGLTRTLAVIAAKKPIRQSLLIKIRGNKAYAHVKKLLKKGFIVSEKRGNTQIIDLTEKFFNYFQVKEDQLKEELDKLKG
ncbi:MAG TPA: SMC-Scp complex subunit ScpB [Candidatus Woesearchaeota archaeon]|nr:SMC-Scp complex subunit ScpB [Candidatus Woesearchaeota archaeon]